MSHQRYPSHDPIKEPHSISLKVLRLSRPSLVTQHPTKPPQAPAAHDAAPIPASLAYAPDAAASTNPDPFLLAPILNLPLSFGSAYATETSGRTRTFRKLYQFICKSSLIVRTKVGSLPGTPGGADGRARRRWVLEAQLENCAEDVVQLERVELDLEAGLAYTDCNWGPAGKPVLHPGEVEQVCFVVEETAEGGGLEPGDDGRIVFGVLGIGWRGEMGNRGYLSTGKLGMRPVAA
ncbi:hypothetical protein VdG1_02096 [Verticillium dahliae VDG1]|nr:hypothetical protein VdG1_02096 [Verticillium dahliae VDG1]